MGHCPPSTSLLPASSTLFSERINQFTQGPHQVYSWPPANNIQEAFIWTECWRDHICFSPQGNDGYVEPVRLKDSVLSRAQLSDECTLGEVAQSVSSPWCTWPEQWMWQGLDLGNKGLLRIFSLLRESPLNCQYQRRARRKESEVLAPPVPSNENNNSNFHSGVLPML